MFNLFSLPGMCFSIQKNIWLILIYASILSKVLLSEIFNVSLCSIKYKKDLHNPDNHYGLITYLEPDMLECEIKWALGRITRNKVSGGDGIPVELFQILKRCCTQYASKFGKLSSGHGTGKGQFSFQSQRKATLTNVQITAQLHSSHMLAKWSEVTQSCPTLRPHGM